MANGAIATIVYNNQPGTISMDLTDYTKTAPCVSVTQSDGAMMKAGKATPVTGEDGKVQYYLDQLTVKEGIGSAVYTPEYNTMSDFSSWGIPGSLELKPELRRLAATSTPSTAWLPAVRLMRTCPAPPWPRLRWPVWRPWWRSISGRRGWRNRPVSHPGNWPRACSCPPPFHSGRITVRRATVITPSCGRARAWPMWARPLPPILTSSWAQTPPNPMPMAR